MIQSFDTAGELSPHHPGLEALDDGFCMVDAEWRITYWNAAAERYLGLRRNRVGGRALWEVLPAWRDGEAWVHLHAVSQEGVARRYHERLPGRRMLSVHAAPLDRGGLVIHFRDATEEVRRAGQYTALLESIRDGFLAVDESWTIVYVNRLAESLLRFPREQAIGQSLWSLYPRRSNDIADCLRATMHDGQPRALREVRPDGRALRGRIFDVWTFPLAGGGISVLFEDVAERVQREGELSRLATEAQAANEAKSRFFAAASHELRTPLNAIVGYTHLLGSCTYGDMPDGAVRAAQRASACAEHLSRLVDDVLLLTTTELGRLPLAIEEVDLASYLPAYLRSLCEMAEAKGLSFRFEMDDDLPPLETDPQRLRQLLVAVASNAVKYTSRGSVTLRVRQLVSSEPLPGQGESYTLFPEPQIEIVVSDTGPGIPLEDRERVFGAFEQLGDEARADSMARGTGLGLSVARQLAGILKGSLELMDTSECGSCFRLRLPLRFPRTPNSS
jgi:PAS domain S-box-containing protein